MSIFRHDPGPCPVDDAPHTTCVAPTSSGSRIVIRQGSIDRRVVVPVITTAVPPLKPSEFTTATYRRPKGKR